MLLIWSKEMSPLIPSVYQHVDTSGTLTVCYSFEIGCTNWAGEVGDPKTVCAVK
jgi:hypothetical protein